MALSNAELLKELSAKPIMEIVELVKMLEDEWGVSRSPDALESAGLVQFQVMDPQLTRLTHEGDVSPIRRDGDVRSKHKRL